MIITGAMADCGIITINGATTTDTPNKIPVTNDVIPERPPHQK
ncbi:hypothetical protein [Companilactobacillus keshanensis]|uniref:Uncharacterized protein n=1 Tax=Companilactobacillus keshanensis TaxID=2486003 RepID=A0ABW4BWR0_9LACO|nr:hypothetical protein [Companilactobacillus keshanensis]